MRLFYLSGSTIPSRMANSVHVMKMCHAFSAIGCDVTLFARPGNNILNDLYEDFGVNRTFSIELREARGPAGWRALNYARAVRKSVVRKGLPDVFYGRHLYSLLMISDLGVPLVFEAHAPPQNPVQKIAEGMLFNRPNFTRLVVISSALRTEYLRLFPRLARQKVVVAHDGADLPSERGGEKADWLGRQGHPQVGYVGHLYPGRGIDLIATLASSLPDVDFHLVGGTELDLEYWRSQCNQENLYFHGYVPHARTGEYLRHFDIVLAPYQRRVALAGGRSDTSRWMSPMKIFEYMAYGKTIIVSDLPVLGEVMRDGENCLVVPPDQPDAWIEAIRRLVNNDHERRKLGDRARRDLQTRYTWKTRAERVLEGIWDH